MKEGSRKRKSRNECRMTRWRKGKKEGRKEVTYEVRQRLMEGKKERKKEAREAKDVKVEGRKE